jgi:mRNA interferase HigB
VIDYYGTYSIYIDTFAIREYYPTDFATGEAPPTSKRLHVISRKPFREAIAKDFSLERPLSEWFKTAEQASWTSLVDVRKTYRSADYVDPYTVFNIKGNAYRLIVKIEYRWKLIFIKHVLTHEEYEKGEWRK